MSDSINEQRCERNGLPISGCAASEYDCAKFGVCAASQPEPATLRITTYGGGKTVQHWQLRYGDLFLADTSVQAHAEQWRQLVAAAASVSTDIDEQWEYGYLSEHGWIGEPRGEHYALHKRLVRRDPPVLVADPARLAEPLTVTIGKASRG